MQIPIPYEFTVVGRRRGSRATAEYRSREIAYHEVPEISGRDIEARWRARPGTSIFNGNGELYDQEPLFAYDGRIFRPVTAASSLRAGQDHLTPATLAETCRLLTEQVTAHAFLPWWSIKDADAAKPMAVTKANFTARSKGFATSEWTDEVEKRLLSARDAQTFVVHEEQLYSDRFRPFLASKSEGPDNPSVIWIDRLACHPTHALAGSRLHLALDIEGVDQGWVNYAPGDGEDWPSDLPLSELDPGSISRHDAGSFSSLGLAENVRRLGYRCLRQLFMNFKASPLHGSGDIAIPDSTEEADEAFFALRHALRPLHGNGLAIAPADIEAALVGCETLMLATEHDDPLTSVNKVKLKSRLALTRDLEMVFRQMAASFDRQDIVRNQIDTGGVRP